MMRITFDIEINAGKDVIVLITKAEFGLCSNLYMETVLSLALHSMYALFLLSASRWHHQAGQLIAV